jgi:cytidyltransferase-like protein|tara:strand:+ start:170 stop:673 length:504 start_codon:yes stop_codon:yes gene_type:complete
MSKLPPTPYDTVLVSGGFDPAHIGHIRMILEAATYGNVIVVANSDAWLMRKKGYIFMPWEERAELLAAVKGVTSVEHVNDTDGTVCEAIRRLKPTYFANGGDRKTDNTPEMDVCKELGVKLLWNVGGGKIQSSSDLVEASGMVVDTESDDPDLPQPTSVEVLMSTKP